MGLYKIKPGNNNYKKEVTAKKYYDGGTSSDGGFGSRSGDSSSGVHGGSGSNTPAPEYIMPPYDGYGAPIPYPTTKPAPALSSTQARDTPMALDYVKTVLLMMYTSTIGPLVPQFSMDSVDMRQPTEWNTGSLLPVRSVFGTYSTYTPRFSKEHIPFFNISPQGLETGIRGEINGYTGEFAIGIFEFSASWGKTENGMNNSTQVSFNNDGTIGVYNVLTHEISDTVTETSYSGNEFSVWRVAGGLMMYALTQGTVPGLTPLPV